MTSSPQDEPQPVLRQTPASVLLQNAGLVFVGGALGALLRAVLVAAFPPDAASWTTLAINLVGAFALAWLAARLLARRPRTLLFFGTGVLGGFTTYSALALDVASRALAGDLGALLLAVLSLAGGIAVAHIGWIIGRMGSSAGQPPQRPPSEPPTVPGGTAVAP